MREVSVLIPLVVGVVATSCTVVIHAGAINATVRLVRRERRLGRIGVHFLFGVAIVMATVLFAFIAHLIDVVLWAIVFVQCGEFSALSAAFYHSAVNYTTLGYGDVVMSPAWKMLGPLEAGDGMLMFGVSTAMVFAVIQGMVQSRFPDLRE